MPAYNQSGPGAAGAQGQGMGTIHIPKDMLPEGMDKEINVGDILEFKVVAKPDAEGDIAVEYNMGEGHEEGMHEEGMHEEEGGGAEGTKPWEDAFREHMSPNSGNADGGNPSY